MSSIFGLVLAAGRGTRLRSALSVPKPLAPINDEPLLQRNLRQMHERGIHDYIVVTGHAAEIIEESARELYPGTKFVHNPQYFEDQNILSTLLGLKQVPEGHGVILLEGDVVFSDMAMSKFLNSITGDTSIWTACGYFSQGQKGGILRATDTGFLTEIRYEDWSPQYDNWFKNLGAIYIAPNQVPIFIGLLERYTAKSIEQYFLVPWADHIQELPTRIVDLDSEAGSFNTMEEYEKLKNYYSSKLVLPEIELIPVKNLKHIENFDIERVKWLALKIHKEGIWTTPLAVSREYLVMDGQHRLEAAKILSLDKIPALIFNYEEIHVFSLRADITLDWQSVVKNAMADNIYPYKTVKHVLPPIPVCSISLEKLFKA